VDDARPDRSDGRSPVGSPPGPSPGSGSGDPSGTVIGGRYRIIRLIATGGMARVYQAMDEVLSRPVAVKMLHEHLLVDDAFVARFHHEAIAAARLSHPSIVSIFDTVSESGDHGAPCEAIVMELVHGTTLRRRLDAVGTLEVAEAVAVGAQVADALDTAHRAHVVHRDIKPANILLSTDGRVLVADFGIAKAAEGHDLTAEGSMLGTAKYLAPEQVEGTGVDGRADVYALGIVLFEALCGRVPFHADTDTATALARLHQAPLRPRQVRADIPKGIEEVVLRAMARHRGDRYADAAQFRAALLGCVHDRTSIEISVDDTAPGATMVDGPVHTGRPVDRTPVPVAAPSSSAPPDRVDAASRRGFGRSERAWLVPTLLIVLVAVALGVVGVLFGQSGTGRRLLGSSGTHAPTTVAAPPQITAVHSFDPEGDDGSENDELLPNLTDGDPSTDWHTSHYRDAPVFGVKDGVGVDLVLAHGTKLDALVVDSSTAGWDAAVYVATGPTGDTLASWGDPVTTRHGLQPGTTTFDLHGRSGNRVLLWFTRPGPSGQITISGLKVR
jgi:serine/threonine-protein kinase